ncbi:MAG: hypothetical protein K6U04_02675 [Armatimonadetes bacterium]|nr:hypothetical protein [Armatimonadota bacterium]
MSNRLMCAYLFTRLGHSTSAASTRTASNCLVLLAAISSRHCGQESARR